MSILPWDNFIKDCYIRLENLVIDGSIKELEEEWSRKDLNQLKTQQANLLSIQNQNMHRRLPKFENRCVFWNRRTHFR